MDLSLPQKYQTFQADIREFLAEHREMAAAAVRGERSAVLDWQQTLVEHGFVGRTIPQEYGGFGGQFDLLEAMLIEQEFAAAGVTLGLQSQGIGMLVPTLLEFATEEQKREIIAPTLRGEMVWCQGYSEPGSGSDLASLTTRGVVDGDDYVINGQKIWTSTAKQAHRMFALVRTEAEAKKHAGISYILIDMKSPGIDVRPLMQMNGDASFNEVFFTDVRVPRANLVGEPGQGWQVGTYTLRHERAMLGRSFHSETYYQGCVQVLRDTGRLEDPIFRDRLMKLQSRVLAMKYHGYRLLSDRLHDRDSGVSALIVKLNGCQLNYDLCNLAVDALGPQGLLKPGSPRVRDLGMWQVEGMYALGLIIGGGTAQIQKNIIAEVGLGMPREPKARIPARG